jgi:DNA-binding NarL/FixJ family response regulator
VFAELQEVTLMALSTAVCDEETLRQFDGVINIYDSAQQLQRKLSAAFEQEPSNPYSDSHDLSERERDVLILVARGKANKEIADELNISIHTVMSHRKNITHKTGIKSVAGLTVYALLNNLLDQADVTL